MERLDPAHAGFACDPPGGEGRQVRALGRKSGIRRRKGSLDEQEVGVSNEADDGRAIGRRVGGVGDIRDLLAGRHRHNVAQPPERQFRVRCGRCGGNPDQMTSGLSSSTARLSARSQGPTGNPNHASRFFQTLTCATSSIAKPRQGGRYELDGQFSRVRLSDKTSGLRPREATN